MTVILAIYQPQAMLKTCHRLCHVEDFSSQLNLRSDEMPC